MTVPGAGCRPEAGRRVALVDTPEAAIEHIRMHGPLAAATEPWSFCVAHCGEPAPGPSATGRPF